MSWTQVKGLSRDPDLTEGLEARLADPLWMLARQRQFGALQGEDAASPLQIEIQTETAAVDEIRLGKSEPQRLDADAPPIEPFVEADPVHGTPGWLRARIEAALDLLARLPEARRGTMAEALAKTYQLAAGATGDPVCDRLAARAFDPTDLLADGRAGFEKLAQDSYDTEADLTAALSSYDAWEAMLGQRFVAPKVPGGLWAERRFDYSFTLRASQRDAELHARGYEGGRFDWYSVDLDSPDGDAFRAGETETTRPLVTRLRYPGMPSRRFWDFEDHRANFGGMELGLTQLPQTLLVEFATVYSDDWYVAPLRVETGHLMRVVKVDLLDVFGGKREIQAAARKDGEKRDWRFFELSGDASVGKGDVAPWLYLPRVVCGGHEGKPLEEVALRRDEAANLAWGIETLVENGAARTFNRATAWAKVRARIAAEMGEDTQAEPLALDDWRFVLETQTPPYWIPFAPGIGQDGYPDGRLTRHRLSIWERWPEAMRALAGPQGLMIAPGGAFSVNEATLPRSGLVLTRAYQAARGADGRLLIWAGRRKRPAGTDLQGSRETDILLDAQSQPLDAPATREGSGG